MNSVWIGYEPRETASFMVSAFSTHMNLEGRTPVHGVYLRKLVESGKFRRPTEMLRGAADRDVMWDLISEAPMSTEHANSRFMVPELARDLGQDHGWALFLDGDVLVRRPLDRLFSRLDSRYALYCVKHQYEVRHSVKMDGQANLSYSRKNWSSVMAFNLEHPSGRRLTNEMVNTLPGRELHRFCWLRDDEIGELGVEWNWLVGISPPCEDPGVVHFTEGSPEMRGYENTQYSGEWRDMLDMAARSILE